MAANTVSAFLVEMVMDILKTELLETHLDTIMESDTGFRYMLSGGKMEDLRRLYSLMYGLPGGIPNMVSNISSYLLAWERVVYRGNSRDPKDVARIGLRNLEARPKSPSKRIGWLVNLRHDFNKLLHFSFDDDPILKKVISWFFNVVLKQETSDFDKINVFIAETLRMEDSQDQRRQLDKIFAFLGSLRADKDAFTTSYLTHFITRMLPKKDVYDSDELYVVSNLKRLLGRPFAGRVNAVIEDMRESESLTR